MCAHAQLFLVGGTPLLLGQNSIRVSYVLDTQPKPVEAVAEGDAVVEEKGIPLQFLTDLVVTPETTTAELKVMIASQFPSVTLSLPNGDSVVVTLSPDKLRVREIVQHKVSVTTSVPKLGKVLIETHSLATTVKPAKMTDGKAIGVHITAVPEAFQEGDLLINLRVCVLLPLHACPSPRSICVSCRPFCEELGPCYAAAGVTTGDRGEPSHSHRRAAGTRFNRVWIAHRRTGYW